MLQYDNSAFYFFCLSTISFYLVPSWYAILSRVYTAFFVDDAKIGAVARTTAEQKKADALRQESKGLATLKSTGFLINLAGTVLFTIIFLWLLMSVSADGQVNSFDPFGILEIDSGADSKVIKKAYRSLSLKYHPDKNPGNRAAEAKFMMVSKAYEALTDETAKENWEKYGNPDGKQSMEVSIGLPDFLLDSGNRNLVLLVYLVIMVGVIPAAVWTYYSDSSKYGEKDVMYDTYSWFHHSLSEHTVTKYLPEVLAGSAEFRKRNATSSGGSGKDQAVTARAREEQASIGTLMTKVRAQMIKPKFNHPVCIKGNVLLHTHLLRKTALLSPNQAADLKYMLRYSTSLIDAMISVCKHQDSLQTAVNCIEFGQYVTQAVWTKDSALLQLPHFTEDVVNKIEGSAAAAAMLKDHKITTVQQYKELLMVPAVAANDDDKDDDKKAASAAAADLGMETFTADQKKDVQNYLTLFPDISVETKISVEDDEDDRVYEGDLCTIQVTITRNNLPDGGAAKAGLVHAPYFPFPRKEAWWVIVGQIKEGKIISIEKVGNPNKVVVHKIKFLAPPKGKYEFDLFVKSNAYVGVDQKLAIEMETLDNTTLPEYKVHADDAVLDDEPTLFEEMLNAHVEQDSDDEDDDDSDDEDDDDDKAEAKEAPKSAAALKKEQLQKARQAADDDDDDDDDDEGAVEVYADK